MTIYGINEKAALIPTARTVQQRLIQLITVSKILGDVHSDPSSDISKKGLLNGCYA